MCKSLGILERFIGRVHHIIVDTSFLLHVMVLQVGIVCVPKDFISHKALSQKRSLFGIKQPRNSIARGRGHMTAESALPRKCSNALSLTEGGRVPRSHLLQGKGSGDIRPTN